MDTVAGRLVAVQLDLGYTPAKRVAGCRADYRCIMAMKRELEHSGLTCYWWRESARNYRLFYRPVGAAVWYRAW